MKVRWDEMPDADLLPAFAASRSAERFYWERADRAVLGLGAARAVEAFGPDRFEIVEAWRRALDRELGDAARPGGGAVVVGGFAFADAAPGAPWRGFPPARFVLPRLLAVRTPDGLQVARFGRGPAPAMELGRLLSATAAPRTSRVADFRARADRSEAAFRVPVGAAIEEIRAGVLEKVVVARSCRLRGASRFDPAHVIGQLRAMHPACAVFGVARGAACFVGASPEQLVERDASGRVAVDAVAGTAARGRCPQEDRSRARALRESKKDQEEHAIVVRAVRAELARLCAHLEVPESPGVLSTGTVHHLHTPIRGLLREEIGVLALGARLHPTPAVGGAPRESALAFLAQHERLDRGWYAGPLGWSGLDGSGALTVALRSVLLRGREAHLHAGAGIVRDSHPQAELEETRLKLRSVLTALLDI